jgi:hypothetical protein
MWTSPQPRLRPVVQPLAAWMGCWFAAVVFTLWRYGFGDNVPFLAVNHIGLLLTPFAFMAMFWWAARVRCRQGHGPSPAAANSGGGEGGP